MTIIPPDQLQPDTLRALAEEFITRHGAIHGHEELSMESQISTLLRNIDTGVAAIVYDEQSQSCSIVASQTLHGSNGVE